MDFLESLRNAPTDSDIHIHPQCIASFNMYLRGNRHKPGMENNVPARNHHGLTFRAMIDDAILALENAGGMARELAAQDSESPTNQNG